jgi:predicted RNA-binding protein with EMAP domain
VVTVDVMRLDEHLNIEEELRICAIIVGGRKMKIFVNTENVSLGLMAVESLGFGAASVGISSTAIFLKFSEVLSIFFSNFPL